MFGFARSASRNRELGCMKRGVHSLMLHACGAEMVHQLEHGLEVVPVVGCREQLGELRVVILAPILPHRVVHICPVQLVLERQPPFLHSTDRPLQHLDRRPLDHAVLEPQQIRQFSGCHGPARDREHLKDVLHVGRETAVLSGEGGAQVFRRCPRDHARVPRALGRNQRFRLMPPPVRQQHLNVIGISLRQAHDGLSDLCAHVLVSNREITDQGLGLESIEGL